MKNNTLEIFCPRCNKSKLTFKWRGNKLIENGDFDIDNKTRVRICKNCGFLITESSLFIVLKDVNAPAEAIILVKPKFVTNKVKFYINYFLHKYLKIKEIEKWKLE